MVNMSQSPNNNLERNRITGSEIDVFLQRVFHWEPQPAFSAWLHEITSGRITLVRRAIAVLLRQGVIQLQGGLWLVDDSYASTSPEALLQQHPMIFNLPLPRNAFIGRFQLRQQITAALSQEHMLTLIGLGGVGKTRLALQIGYDSLAKFQHGVCLVSLSGIKTAALLAEAIVQALRTLTYGQGSLDEQLIDYLRNKNLLLILDNYEHLLPATDLIKKILDNAPSVHLLITSRERLKLYQESVITVPTFSLPQQQDDFETSDAAQLFLQRARKVRQNFILKEIEVPYVHQICHLVGALPLGIELAASWVRVLTCQAIAQEIEQDFDLLQTEIQDISERHRNVQAIVEYSWRRLDDDEKHVFSRLAIFQEAFSREAVAQIVGLSVPMLARLIDKSLLTREDDGRFSMHPILRQFAREKLVALDNEQRETLYDAFAAYYFQLVQSYEFALQGVGQSEALSALTQDVNNIQAAWQWAVQRGGWRQLDQGLEAIYRFYLIRNWFHEGAGLFRHAVDQLKTSADELDTERILGKLQARQGSLMQQLGQHEEAHRLIQWGLQVARANDASRELAFCLGELAEIRRHQGKLKEAQSLANESLTHFERIHDQHGISAILTKLGCIANVQRDHKQASILAERAILVCKQIGNIRDSCVAYNILGNLATMGLRFDTAREWFRQSLTLSQEIGDRRLEASAIGNIGVVAQREAHYETANHCFYRELHIYQEIGLRYDEAKTLYLMGHLYGSVGDYESALHQLENARWLFDEIQNRRGRNWVEGEFGIVYLRIGAYREAHIALTTAINTAEALDDKPHLSQMLAYLALLSHEMGDQKTAIAVGQRALMLAQEIQSEEAEIRSLIYLGRIYLAEGAYQQAFHSYEKALMLCDDLKVHQVALDAQAGLAIAALKLGQQETAAQHLQVILAHLETHHLDGTDDQFVIFLNCYYVLRHSSVTSARDLLAQAHQALRHQAEKLIDSARRDQFYHQVKTHQMILHLYKQPTAQQDNISEPLPGSVREVYLRSKLTSREMEIAHLIMEGRRNREIAEELVISNHTVKRHVSNIFNKLGITNRYELIKLAHDDPNE